MRKGFQVRGGSLKCFISTHPSGSPLWLKMVWGVSGSSSPNRERDPHEEASTVSADCWRPFIDEMDMVVVTIGGATD